MSEKGIIICNRIKLTLKYCDEAKKYLINKDVNGKPTCFVLLTSLSLSSILFIRIIRVFGNGIICCLMHSFVEN